MRYFSDVTWVDLTYPLTSDTPHWEGACGFQLTTNRDYTDYHTKTKFRDQYIHAHAGIGTHIDAPAHCISGGVTVGNIPLENLISSCVVIDIESRAHEHYRLSVDDIFTFERKYGPIAANSFVIIHTGWGKYWGNPIKYRNDLVFPSVSSEAAEYLIERGISGLGIDTLSPDRLEDDFPVHQIILGAGKHIVENIANAMSLPAIGAGILVIPMKIQEGAEAPVRLIGVKNKDI